MKNDEDELVRVTFRLPASLARELREECEHFKVGLDEVVADALLFWLEEHMVPSMAGIDGLEEWHWRGN